jgi:putative hydrolase of the HAD superfamily
MIFVFDLDDTLYDEINYVKSGFKNVSKFLSIKYNFNPNILFEIMINELEKNGRGQVFDKVLKLYQQDTKKNINECIKIYRNHIPTINLRMDSVNCFKRFINYPKYVLTDGNKIVQNNKVMALEVDKYVKKVLITHRFGIKHSKPSPYLFFKISEWENESYENIVYIGDNPYKDFIGIKKYGFKTIRIINGMFKDVILDSDHEADITINNLDKLTIDLLIASSN